MDENKMIEHLAESEMRFKSIERRLEKGEETIKEISSLSQSIAKMSVSLSNAVDTIKDLKTDVADLKNTPRKRWDTVIAALISSAAGGVIGYIISML